jgi:hypothetical protein
MTLMKVTLENLATRVSKLERAVFGNGASKGAVGRKDFKGATGGLRFLITKGFFDRRRRFVEITAELEKQGYHYSRQAVQTPLTRLSRVGGPLVSLDDKGKKAYAKRK